MLEFYWTSNSYPLFETICTIKFNSGWYFRLKTFQGIKKSCFNKFWQWCQTNANIIQQWSHFKFLNHPRWPPQIYYVNKRQKLPGWASMIKIQSFVLRTRFGQGWTCTRLRVSAWSCQKKVVCFPSFFQLSCSFLSYTRSLLCIRNTSTLLTSRLFLLTSKVELLGIEISLSAIFALYKGVTSLGSLQLT